MTRRAAHSGVALFALPLATFSAGTTSSTPTADTPPTCNCPSGRSRTRTWTTHEYAWPVRTPTRASTDTSCSSGRGRCTRSCRRLAFAGIGVRGTPVAGFGAGGAGDRVDVAVLVGVAHIGEGHAGGRGEVAEGVGAGLDELAAVRVQLADLRLRLLLGPRCPVQGEDQRVLIVVLPGETVSICSSQRPERHWGAGRRP